MAHKTLVNGTNYEMCGGNTLVNGTAYSIKNGNALVDGTAYEVGFVKTFADFSWEEIIAACQNNEIPDNWVVGDQKVMTIGGADYVIDIIGKNHDVYSDGGNTAPLTFQFHELVQNDLYYDYMMTDTLNTGGYDSSLAYTSGLPSVLGAMPSTVQSAIKSVNKKSSVGNKSTTIETISCKLFPLSEVEILGTSTKSAPGEGTRYEYYSAGNSAQKCPCGTTAFKEYWTRSPGLVTNRVWCVIETGGAVNTTAVRNQRYISPAFCF